MTLQAGDRLGPYEIEGVLGAGGMGQVFRARDPRLDRSVAIKMILPDVAADADRLRRFEQEARACGSLSHPNVVAVYDVGSHDGGPYLVTELLEGETLRQRLGGGPMPVRKAADVAVQVARGLSAAHERGIVHRDLKPENVFLTKDGVVKILDFGLARLERRIDESRSHTTLTAATGSGIVVGTVGYMSPEQVRGEAVDHRSDIFAFGALFYEMLAGRRAFPGATSVEALHAILYDDPPEFPTTTTVPPSLDRVVRHCLEKKPEDRVPVDARPGVRARGDRRDVGHVGPHGGGAGGRAGTPPALATRRGGGRRRAADGARRLPRRPPERPATPDPEFPSGHLPSRPRQLGSLRPRRPDRGLRGRV